jgi:hypothetical protein
VERRADVPVFVRVTAHSATTLPVGSFTVPTNVPNVDCARALLMDEAAIVAATTM